MKVKANLLQEMLKQIRGPAGHIINEAGIEISPTRLFSCTAHPDQTRQVSTTYTFPAPQQGEPMELNLYEMKKFIDALARFGDEEIEIIADRQIILKSDKRTYTCPQLATEAIRRGREYDVKLPVTFTLLCNDMDAIMEDIDIATKEKEDIMVVMSHAEGANMMLVTVLPGTVGVKYETVIEMLPEIPAFKVASRMFHVIDKYNGTVTFSLGPKLPIRVRYETTSGIKVEHLLAPRLDEEEIL